MTFVQRYTGPLLAWIPDLSDIPTGRVIGIGIVISLLLHLVLFLMIPLISVIFPDKGVNFSGQPMKTREIELTVIPPPPAPAFTLAPKPEHLFIDSRGLDIAKDAAADAIFESDENMHAASELPASGDLPLPSQIGKDRPFNAFETTRSLLGPVAEAISQPLANDTPLRPTPAPPADQTSPTPPAPPVPQLAQQVPLDTRAKTPAPTPQKTEKKLPTDAKDETKPTQLREVKKLAEDEIALQRRESIREAITAILKPVSTPPPVTHAAVLRPLDEDLAKLATPAPRPQSVMTQTENLGTPVPRMLVPPKPGYQPEQEKTHIEGNISNRGKNAVASVATPMAKYRKQVNDAIGSRWYYYIKDKMDLLAFGSVRISFVIDSQGHISRTRVESNTSNSSLASVSVQAIEEAEIGPPPRDPDSGAITEEPLDWTLTFTYYPFSQ